MRTLFAIAVGAACLLATAGAYAANARTMTGAQGAEGAAWVPILFATVIFGLVMWVLSQLASERREHDEEPGKFEQMRNRSY